MAMKLVGNQSLGCIICRGPLENPGVFVQTVKPGGVALEAGLEPGDEIVECNGIGMSGLSFQDAVCQLKSDTQLDLIIRKQSGLAFVSPEIGCGRRKVGPESFSPAGENSQDGSVEVAKFKFGEERLKVEQERLLIERMKEKAVQDNHEKDRQRLEEERRELEKTQIALERRKLEAEQEKVRRESEELEKQKKLFDEERRKKMEVRQNVEPVSGGNGSTESSMGNGGLQGAIQTELMRRKANKDGTKPEVPLKGSKAKKRNLTNVMKNDQHDKLIAEFRQVRFIT